MVAVVRLYTCRCFIPGIEARLLGQAGGSVDQLERLGGGQVRTVGERLGVREAGSQQSGAGAEEQAVDGAGRHGRVGVERRRHERR